MIQVPEDRRPPLTPQLAMFAIIFFRLWYLQVLSGNKYVAQARVNFVRKVDVPAPRGEILDASGNVLVNSVRSIAVQISPPSLPVPLQTCDRSMFVAGVWSSACMIAHPPRADAGLYNRLAGVVGLPTKRQRCHVDGYGYLRLSPIGCAVAQGYVLLPYASVTVKQDVSNKDVLLYLEERQRHFPGVSVKPVWLRTYPLHDLAAQIFGTIGPISRSELKDARFKGLPQSAVVGQSGLEWAYNHYLQGIDGDDQVRVDALGHFTGYARPQVKPIAGHNLKLSLDVGLQKIGQQALQQSIDSNYPANAGAFVAMNPVTGEIYAMGSLPTFDPNIFTKPVPSSVYAQLNNPASNYPLINRAIGSAGPTGSSFKPITATAALESRRWSIYDTYDDTGQFCIGTQCRHNAGGAANGVLNLVDAIRVSDDVFFYNLGALTNSPAPNGGPLQYWAHQYGIGRKSGVDIGGEVPGTLPSARWRAQRNREEAECDSATGPFKGKPKHPPGGCGIRAQTPPGHIRAQYRYAAGQVARPKSSGEMVSRNSRNFSTSVSLSSCSSGMATPASSRISSLAKICAPVRSASAIESDGRALTSAPLEKTRSA